MINRCIVVDISSMGEMNFTAWVAHWGEQRLEDRIESSQKCHCRMWERRNNEVSIRLFPTWELRVGNFWQESLEKWHSRWISCGGRLFENRMIAAKWDVIWGKLSDTFDDGFSLPYPPYARSSCAYWREIDQDESIVLGVISEAEFLDHVNRFPRKPLLDKDGNPVSIDLLRAVRDELAEQGHRLGGPPPNATRTERVAHRHAQAEISRAQQQAVSELKSDVTQLTDAQR